MRDLAIRIDESRSDKRKLRLLVKSIKETISRMVFFPETDFLSEIIKQIIINEDLETILEVVIDRDDRILLMDSTAKDPAVEIVIIDIKVDYGDPV